MSGSPRDKNRCDTAMKRATVFVIACHLLSHTPPGCSAATVLQKLAVRHDCADLRKSRCEHAGQRHIGSLDSVASKPIPEMEGSRIQRKCDNE